MRRIEWIFLPIFTDYKKLCSIRVMYSHIFVAGTFDGLHAGHLAILTRAFAEGKKVTIGLTSDEFVRTFKIHNSKFIIRSYVTRKKDVQSWLHTKGYFQRATIIPISDPHEPAASMKDLDALIITRENRTTGERINALRQGSTLSPLTLIEVPIVAAQDGKPISSTRLRNGEIDSDGRLVMPEALRGRLGNPMGNILRGKEMKTSIASHQRDTVLTVGDLSTKTVLDAGVVPRLVVIDGQVGRKPFPEIVHRFQPQKASLFQVIWVKSGPGFISREAIKTIRNCFTHHSSTIPHHVLIIDGEEDLLVLPVIEYAPIGSILYYGQPGEGLVEVKITKSIKEQVRILLTQFVI